MDLTTTINGVIYCNYCTKVLKEGEICDCKSSQKAIAKAKEKEKRANLPKHEHDRPPRGLEK